MSLEIALGSSKVAEGQATDSSPGKIAQILALCFDAISQWFKVFDCGICSPNHIYDVLPFLFSAVSLTFVLVFSRLLWVRNPRGNTPKKFRSSQTESAFQPELASKSALSGVQRSFLLDWWDMHEAERTCDKAALFTLLPSTTLPVSSIMHQNPLATLRLRDHPGFYNLCLLTHSVYPTAW